MLSAVEIPEITVIGYSRSYSLGRIYNGPAAYRKYEIYSLFTADLDALVDKGIMGIRLYSAQLCVADAGAAQ